MEPGQVLFLFPSTLTSETSRVATVRAVARGAGVVDPMRSEEPRELFASDDPSRALR